MGQELNVSLGSWVTLTDPFPALLWILHNEFTAENSNRSAREVGLIIGVRRNKQPNMFVSLPCVCSCVRDIACMDFFYDATHMQTCVTSVRR